jgi:hypothetical protein
MHINPLTPAEAERLAILIEEASEVIKVACKILRHGYGPHTYKGINYDNRRELETEMGDVRAIMIMMCDKGDVRKHAIHTRADDKAVMIREYLHHDL